VDTDIIIAGGGPVGAALSLALKDSGLPMAVLESRSSTSSDPRPIALSHGSRLLLERLGAWPGGQATPIHEVHVSQRGAFGRVNMSARDAGVAALGYVIEYAVIDACIRAAARDANTRVIDGARVSAIHRDGDAHGITYQQKGAAHTLRARLVVVADGGDIAGFAPPRITDYQQHALTARVMTAKPHQHVAYERFTPEGPIALLPMQEACALVWTLAPPRAEALLAAEKATFLRELRAAFGGRLGDFTAVTHRASYPLSLKVYGEPLAGVIPIGNAAQTLHPVAGQGFNLGLRDAWELARLIRATDVHALNGAELARSFHRRRRIDRGAVVAATHGLVQLFANDMPLLEAARGAGMTLLGALTPAKQFVARRMMLGTRG
jgi:2-octaprenyl-6-methoxyphenol hydroxylase